MITSSKVGVQKIVTACVNNGVKHVVCSPGSRNAPLVIAFDEHPQVQCHLIHDERVAAFYALGMSLHSGDPVALLCTSGSASLNYYPAIAEAYYQGVPLVAITADRPEEWINHGDGQTIVQRGVFSNHIRYELDLNGDEKSPQQLEQMTASLNQAFQAACQNWNGPIHINVAVDEPLYTSVEIEAEVEYPIQHLDSTYNWTATDLESLGELWSSKRKMILVGQLKQSTYLKQLLSQVADDMSVVVLVENISNLHDPKFIHCIDRSLETFLDMNNEMFQPEILITLGGAVISKKIKAFLRSSPIKEHWRIAYDFPQMDTYRKLTRQIPTTPEDFVQQLLKLNSLRNTSDFGAKWRQKDFLAKDELNRYVADAPFSDFYCYGLIFDLLPEETTLHMANSSVVRYCQLFDPIPGVNYYCNRGTSGIDGSTSTASGAARLDPDHLHVLITGDISFFYDSNALWNNDLPQNLKIVLINNGGGGIFKIIPGPASTRQQERFFEAKHNFSAEHICKTFATKYIKVTRGEDLETSLATFFEVKGIALLEIFTDSNINHTVLQNYFGRIKSV